MGPDLIHVYTLTYHALSANQSLEVSWTLENSYANEYAEADVSLSAATLQVGEPSGPVAPQPDDGTTLTLNPPTAGPNVVGTTQAFTSTLQTRDGAPIANTSVQLQVTGATTTTLTATTNSAGVASFSYTGLANGTDTVQASATVGQREVTSAVVSVGWVRPAEAISTSTVWGRFFATKRWDYFIAKPTDTPVLTMTFPTINFNPPRGSTIIPGNTSGVDEWTKPFTSVTTDIHGQYTGVIPAASPTYQAGVLNPTSMTFFNAVFTSNFVVAAAGTLTLRFWSDDAFILGVGPSAQGQQPTRVKGEYLKLPASGVTAFEQFPLMGGRNTDQAPAAFEVTIFFPAPGTYPYELDYAQVNFDRMTLVMSIQDPQTGTITGLPPSGALALSPATVTAKPTGQTQTLSVKATDASGLDLPNLPVAVQILGANPQTLNATTNVSGTATVTYRGANVGTDTAQATGWISGIPVYSGQVSVPWTKGSAPSPADPYTVPGVISSPRSQSVISDTVPIVLAAGTTLQQGTISYWPADNPDAVTVLATNVQASGGATLAVLDTTVLANGSYVIAVDGQTSAGVPVHSAVMDTVTGDYKPGRVRFSVTDLTVPLTGMPITIGRTYDSLERQREGDFGYGWALSIGNPRLTVDPAHNVTLTQPNGQRVTFYFRPASYGGFLGFLLKPAYLPEAGVYGSLTADGCSILAGSGNGYICFLDKPDYQPTTYTYTDPYGRVFTMASDGTLRKIQDLNGNVLAFTSSGITSSAGGAHVTFTRDSQGRITQITDPAGQIYTYGYDSNGDLVAATYPKPDTTTPAPKVQYFYVQGQPHLYERSLDPLGRTASISRYDSDGRITSTTEFVDAAIAYTTTFSYDLATKTITKTNPDGGKVVDVYGQSTLPLTVASPINLIRETVDVRTNAQGAVESSTTVYKYDAKGQLIATGLPDPITGLPATLAINPLTCASRNICYAYDASGNRTRVTDALGHTTITEYNKFNRPSKVIDPLGKTKVLSYDRDGNISTIQDELGLIGGYTFDDHGNPESRYLGKDASKATHYTYDTYGNVATVTDSQGNTTTFTNYDFFGNPGTVTKQADDGLGTKRTTVDTNQYNTLGRVIQSTVAANTPQKSSTIYQYDTVGNVVATTDQETGWGTTYDYYDNGQVKQAVATGTTPVSYTYTWRGDVETMTDSQGKITRNTYDLAGHLVTVTENWKPGKAATQTYIYDLAGRQAGVADAKGQVSTVRFDDADRPTYLEDPVHGSAQRMNLQYDDANHVDKTVSLNGAVTHYQYDPRGFATDVTYAEGTPFAQTTHQKQDGWGRITEQTDANQNSSSYTYNDAGQVIASTNPLSETTHYIYTGQGQLRRIIDADNHATTFDYDALGRTISKTWSDQTTESWTYDYVQLAGATTARTRASTYGVAAADTANPTDTYLRVADHMPDGNVNYNYFNSQGQLVREQLFDGENIYYTYTTAGLIHDVKDARGTTCYTFDDEERIIRVEQLGTGANLVCGAAPAERTISYTYDVNGERTTVAVQVGGTTTIVGYAYDALYRVCAVKNGGIPSSCADASAYQYTYEDHVSSAEVAQRRTMIAPNGVVEVTSFDPLGRISSIVQRYKLTTLASYVYTYDKANRQQTLTEIDGTKTTWAYDNANRLTRELRTSAANSPLWDLNYTYDAVGNRKTFQDKVSGAVSVYAYRPNGLNQIESVTTNGSTRQYSYDLRGNVTSDGNASYTYTAKNMLATVTSSGLQEQLWYDALGNRIQQSINGVKTSYLWDEFSPYGTLLADIDGSGAVQTSYVHVGITTLEQTRAGTSQMLLQDAQSNTRSLINTDNATVAEQYVYDAFGNLRTNTPVPSTTQLYTDQQFDVAAGLYNMRARMYNANDGRFLTRDTYAMGDSPSDQLNRYAYGANNPVNGVDPSGQFFIERAATEKMDAEQKKAHERYHTGLDLASGLDLEALEISSILFAADDELFVRITWAAFQVMEEAVGKVAAGDTGSIDRHITMALGTVGHLNSGVPSNTISKAVTFNSAPSSGLCQWSKVAGNIGPICEEIFGGRGARFLQMAVVSLLRAITLPIWPTANVVGIRKRQAGDNMWDSIVNWKKDHAEVLVVRWALRNFGQYPTPYRMLDIATSRSACSKPGLDGTLSCEVIMGRLNMYQPFLFQTTVTISALFSR